MYKKIVWLLFTLLLLIPTVIKAQCSTAEIVRLKKIAANVNFSYTYETTEYGGIDFTITINNLHPDIYIIDRSKGKIYENNAKGEVVSVGYSAGMSAQFEILSNYSSCREESLLINYVALPFYNPYYSDPLCKGIENFRLCQKWSRVEMSYTEVQQEIKAYKESLISEPIEEEIEHNLIVENIIDFLAKYGMYIYISIIIVCGSLIFYLRRKDDFDLKVK